LHHHPPVDRTGNLDFASVRALIAHIKEYIDTWNADPRPFTWVATADEILAKVQVVVR
jgi:hypothetical protein